MIVGAAVCPGAPFLMGGTADAIANGEQELVRACAAAVSQLPDADLTLLIAGAASPTGTTSTSGVPTHRLLPPGTRIPATSFRRSDLPDPYSLRLAADTPAADQPAVVDPSVGTIVGAYLLGPNARRRPRSHTLAIEVADDPVGVAQAVGAHLAAAARVAVLVIGNGSACHGDAAPGRRDDRAEAFDAALGRALAAGDPVALAEACADRVLARELLADVDPLAVLAALTTDLPPDRTDLLFDAAPLGVGYLAGLWLWTPS